MNRFPALHAAAEEIAFDNGMVNRFATKEPVVKQMLDSVWKVYSLGQLEQAEAEMQGHIEAGRLNEVCCGGDDRETAISPLLDEILNEMFEPTVSGG